MAHYSCYFFCLPVSDLPSLDIALMAASFKQVIVCNLRIVIWNFSAVSGKANFFYLNQLELTLTLP
jgi:hypothetical protein